MENDQTGNEPKSRPKPSQNSPPQTPSLTSPSSALELSKQRLKEEIPLKTAWPRFQRLLKPASGQFWVVGGNPGNFKTQTLWNLATDMAAMGQRILFVSLEIEPWAMASKAISRFSRIPLDRIKAASRSEEPEYLCTAELEALDKAELHFKGLDFRIRFHGPENGRTASAVVKSACRSRFDSVFIDHLGMMSRQGEDEQKEVPRVVEACRALSHGEVVDKYRPCVFLASPLRKAKEDADEDRLPMMDDLRGSQQIQSDADIVLMLQKRAKKNETDADVVDGFVVKARDGVSPLILIFDADGATCTVTERHRDPVPPPDAEEPEQEERYR